MARHLLIGNGGAATITAGIVPDTGIVFQADTNAAFHATTETIITSKRFRVMQGTAGANIVSPWITGKNIISVTGTKPVSAVPYTSTVTALNNSNVAGEVDLKFARKGGETPEFFHISVAIPTGKSATQMGVYIFDAYNAAIKPDWLAAVCTKAAGVVTFSGVNSSATWEEPASNFVLIVVGSTVGATSFTALQNQATALSGSGVGYDVLKLEKELQGINFGYYNRVKLPNAPALTAVGTSAYSIITIVATKDGSTSSSINGVDNLIHIDIAMVDDAVLETLQTSINAYFTSAGFATIDATE